MRDKGFDVRGIYLGDSLRAIWADQWVRNLHHRAKPRDYTLKGEELVSRINRRSASHPIEHVIEISKYQIDVVAHPGDASKVGPVFRVLFESLFLNAMVVQRSLPQTVHIVSQEDSKFRDSTLCQSARSRTPQNPQASSTISLLDRKRRQSL